MIYKLPCNFKVGATGAAWQMEGEEGKRSYQKHFPDLMYEAYPERWHNGIGPKVASDFYNHYKEDIKLFSKVGITQYRFNIDWSRFIDNYETGEVNEEAARFYDDVINLLIKAGIEPVICLEHWELPEYYYKKYDGYASREVVDMFVKYAEEVFKRYRDRVKLWFTFNEPIVIPQLCFMDGYWWPYVTDTKRAFQWIHGKVLATACVINKFRKMKMEGKIGVILNPFMVYPRSRENIADVKAAEAADDFYWKSFVDPSVYGEYPKSLIEMLRNENCLFHYTETELDIIRNNTVDLLGINYYRPLRVKAQQFALSADAPFHPMKYFEEWEMPGRRMNPYRGWEIDPKTLYDIGIRIKEHYHNIEWVVAESGMGVENEERFRDDTGMINDDYRTDFIKEHLAWLLKAVEEGSNCQGYWLFASIDNCSPYNAFKNRYGLIEVDLLNGRERRIKKSGVFYQQLSKNREFEFDNIEGETSC